jgi:hypothetical protein
LASAKLLTRNRPASPEKAVETVDASSSGAAAQLIRPGAAGS